jgi:hypothetical protein
MADLFDAPFPKTSDFAAELRRSMELIQSAAPPAPTMRLAQSLGEALQKQNNAAVKAQEKAIKDDPSKALELAPVTWDQVRTGMRDFDTLPYSQQLARYNEFVKGTVEAIAKRAPKVDQDELAAQLRQRFPAPAAPERSLLESAEDKARSFGSGLVGFVGSVASALNPDPTGTGRRSVESAVQDIEAGFSPVRTDELRQEAFERAQIDPNDPVVKRLWEEAKLAGRNLSLDDIANLLGSVAPSLLTGGVAAAGTSGLARAGGVSAARAAAAGRIAGVATGGGLEGVSTAGEAGASAYDAVLAMPVEILQRAEGWGEALQAAGGDEAAARATLAERAATRARAVGFVAGTGLSLLPGSLESAVARSAARSAAGEGVTGTASRALAQVIPQAGIEGLTEASGDVASMLGRQTVDPNARLEGAGESFLLGALGGAVIGGPLAAIEARQQDQQAPAAPAAPGARAPADLIDELTPGAGGGAQGSTTGGTTVSIGGAQVQQGANGWEYAPGATPNPAADAFIARNPRGGAPAPASPTADVSTAVIPPAQAAELQRFGFAPEQIVRMTQPAADFNSALYKALELRQVPLGDVQRLEAQIGQAVSSLRPLSLDTNQQQLAYVAAALRSASPGFRAAVNKAMQATAGQTIGAADGSAIGFAARQLGYGDALQSNPAQWAEQVRAGTNDTAQVLDTLQQDPVISTAVRQGASAVVQLYRDSGITPPAVKIGNSTREMGNYDPSQHVIRVTRNSDSATLIHEALHGLTARGMDQIAADARNGDAMASSFVSLLSDIREKLLASGSVQYYATSATSKKTKQPVLDEMFAEIMSPEFLAHATQVRFGEPSADSKMAFDALQAKSNDTLFEVVIKALKAIIEYITPGSQIEQGSVADILARAVAHATAKTASLQKIGSPSLPGGESRASQVRTQQAVNAGANNSTKPMPSQRQTMPQVIADIETGQAAPPATPWRKFTQAAKRGDRPAMRESLAELGRVIDEKAHDHLRSWVDWTMALPITDGAKRTLIGAMRLAPGIRDQLLRFARTEYGDAMYTKLGEISKKTGRTAETVEHDVGYWVTARYAAVANQKLIDKAVRRLDVAQRAAQRRPTQANVALANQAQADLDGLILAVNNPDTTVRQHAYGVGGMTNPQAQRLMAAIEQRYDKADLESVADSLYALNGWNLMVAITSGKASPGTVAEFLGRKDLLPQFKQLKAAAEALDAADPQSFDRLNNLMQSLQQEVRTQYVPLTGNPDTALDEELIQSGTQQPNVAADREMLGRTSSAPDNAIRATIGALIRNTSYAGWSKFQDAIADAYSQMSTDEQAEAGIHRQTVDSSNSANRIGENAIVRRRGSTTHAYYFKNQKLLPALRNAYVLDGDKLVPFFGKATKLYAYWATQMNPFFAPKNLARDMWERTENMRTRDYFDENGVKVDSTKLARNTLWWLAPNKLQRLIKVGAKYGLGKKLTGATIEERYLQEFLQAGGASVFGDKFNRSAADIAKAIDHHRGSAKNAFEGAKKWIEFYNRGFDMAPPLAAYISMREAGMTRDDAAAGALDLMNFRKKGEWMALPNSIWAFAQPAAIGGANLIQYLRTPRGRVRLVGQALVLLAIQAAARELADDDEGGNRLDQQSDSTHAANLLLPFGESGVLKLPLAFGHARLANSIARATLGFSLSEKENKDLAEAAALLIGNGITPAFTPFEDTEIDWAKHPFAAAAMLLTPSVLKPPTSIAVNRKTTGSKVVNDKFEDPKRYRSEQFGKRTPPIYKDLAIGLRELSGVDMAPEEVQAIIRGYPLGAGQMLLNGLVENPYKESRGQETVSPIVAPIYSPYADAARYFSFKDAIERSDELTRAQSAAGAKPLTVEQQKLQDWRRWWDKQDRDLRNAKAQITRAKGISEETRERRRQQVDDKRERLQNEALFRYRTEVQGLPAKRTEQ